MIHKSKKNDMDENENISSSISVGKKLFQEIDKPTDSKIVSEDKEKGIVERESRWTGKLKGFDSFPDGTLEGSGRSYIHNNGVTISHWQGIFIVKKGSESNGNNETVRINFKGRDTNKNRKYIVLRTFFTGSPEFQWMDGLVCIAQGDHNEDNSFSSTGYEWLT
jgi:hypothetical protein